MAAPAKVRVEVLPKAQAEAAGINGLLVRLGRTDGVRAAGPVEVGIDYAAFATAYGGDWASRLRLAQLPDCALSTPAAADCRSTPLNSRNDVRTRTVTTTVSVPEAQAAAVFALTAGPSGASRRLRRDQSLALRDVVEPAAVPPASFDLVVPDACPAGPRRTGRRTLGLGYSVAVASTGGTRRHQQPAEPGSGEGFEFSPGFVERRYKACADDMGGNANNTVKTGDLCWGPENAVMSLNGSTVELLKGSDGTWHPRSENGTKVELLTASAYANGDNDNEYWQGHRHRRHPVLVRTSPASRLGHRPSDDQLRAGPSRCTATTRASPATPAPSPPPTATGSRRPGGGTSTTSRTSTATPCPTGGPRRPTTTPRT